jgi:hypothetical protein
MIGHFQWMLFSVNLHYFWQEQTPFSIIMTNSSGKDFKNFISKIWLTVAKIQRSPQSTYNLFQKPFSV